MTAAEVLFSVTGLEFAYSQAPISMKSVVQAFWCLTSAGRDLIEDSPSETEHTIEERARYKYDDIIEVCGC